MSTNRRRPSGGLRRPQVAGRPRTGGPSESTESQERTDGTLAVDERSDADRSGAVQSDADRSGAANATTAGHPMTPVGGSSPDRADASSTVDRETAQGPEAESEHDAGADAGPGARRRRISLPSPPVTRRGTAALLAVTILLAAAAVFFAVSLFGMRFTGSATNTALSDVGATATVSEQVGDAVTKVYSFDFARLDQAEADARAGITAPFDKQFDQIFGNVRQLAPKQKAVVTATVPKKAVASIEGDHATVYLFVNQVITRVDDNGARQQGGAAARLRVDAENVDGRWKISGMSPA